MSVSYYVPLRDHRVECIVMGSRFIATAGCAPSVERARAYIQKIRAEMPDATHHVYGFRVGSGASVIEGMSDDGEPANTAGSPVLHVIRGSRIGDLVIVVTRYFGGRKLGTGGLVRAYTQAAQAVLADLPITLNVPLISFQITLPYSTFSRIEQLITTHNGTIAQKTFDHHINLQVQIIVKCFGRNWTLAVELINC